MTPRRKRLRQLAERVGRYHAIKAAREADNDKRPIRPPRLKPSPPSSPGQYPGTHVRRVSRGQSKKRTISGITRSGQRFRSPYDDSPGMRRYAVKLASQRLSKYRGIRHAKTSLAILARAEEMGALKGYSNRIVAAAVTHFADHIHKDNRFDESAITFLEEIWRPTTSAYGALWLERDAFNDIIQRAGGKIEDMLPPLKKIVSSSEDYDPYFIDEDQRRKEGTQRDVRGTNESMGKRRPHLGMRSKMEVVSFPLTEEENAAVAVERGQFLLEQKERVKHTAAKLSSTMGRAQGRAIGIMMRIDQIILAISAAEAMRREEERKSWDAASRLVEEGRVVEVEPRGELSWCNVM
jgi:hypothetical protein